MQRLRHLSILLLVFVGCCVELSAQRVSIQTHLDRSEIRIGERAAVEMTIRTDNLAATRFHLVEDSTGNERFRILEFGALDTINVGGTIQEIKARMIITSFDSTLITIPPIVVETPSGSAVSKPLALNVVSPEVDLQHPDRFKPIQDPWDEPYTLKDILILIWTSWITYVAILIALLLLFIYEYKRRMEYMKEPEPVYQPPTTAFETFLTHLEALKGMHLEEQVDFKVYYTSLTSAVRSYLGQVLHFDALEKTTDELLEALHSYSLNSDYLRTIEELMRVGDFVKFAKSLPLRSEVEQVTRSIYEQTRTFHLAWLVQQEKAATAGKEVAE
ncbi:hypothetical protein [Porphyromonas sp.]